MTIITLPIHNSLKNLNYLIYCPHTRDCCVIDPLNVDLILETAERENLNITQIINTHEHGDHTDGNEALKEKTNARVMAHHGAKNLIPGFDQGLKAKDKINIGSSIELTVLDTPGHTIHSICLYNEKNPAVFTGDTLFNCGCGNCHNGGDPQIMFETFENQLQHLPDETKIYPGHDYIRNNLGFAKSFQPKLHAIAALENKLSQDIYISTLGEDKTVDPFFRLDDVELMKTIGLSESADRKSVFLRLRELRNKW